MIFLFKKKLTIYRQQFYLYRRKIEDMGLQLRITFNDTDYTYQIINSKLIDQYTTELELMLDGEKVGLLKDKDRGWIQKDGDSSLDPGLVLALGRSVSLRLRM